jgi:hypothetical protein
MTVLGYESVGDDLLDPLFSSVVASTSTEGVPAVTVEGRAASMHFVRLVDSYGDGAKIASLYARIEEILRPDHSDAWVVWIRNEGEAFSGHALHQPRLLGPSTGDIPACDIRFFGDSEEAAAESFADGLTRRRRDA